MLRLSERNYLLIAIGWTFVIIFLSLVNLNNVPAGKLPIPNKDKIVHFLFYFFFVWFWYKANIKITLFKLVLIAVVFGIIIEALQGLCTVNRQADLFDAIANTCGAVVAMLIFRYKQKRLS